MAPAPTRLLSDTDLPAPVGDRWFEDYLPGSSYEFGTVRVCEAEIVEFAELRIRVTVSQARLSRSRPDRGLVHTAVETLDQQDQMVTSFVALNFFACRSVRG